MTEYTFTAFTEQDLLNAGAEGHSVNCGDTFTMPAEATTCFTVHDDDACLSGDRYDHATDHSGQTATIEGADGSHLGNGGQIYAEKYFWVHDNAGNWYVMLEIEQEGSDDDYFAFYTGGHYTVPPAGAELTVHSECDVSGEWLRYDDIDAGDKGPDNGWIKGRLTFDADCNDNEWNDETHTWDEGVAHKTVQLVDLDGNVVAEATTDAHGNYMFDVAPGEYKVKFPLPDGFKFSAKDSGVDEHFDSDANPDGLTDTIHVSSGQTIHDVDAGLKPVGPEFILDDDCAYTIEAEDMMLTNYKVEHVATASGGEVASLAGTGQHAGFAKVDFGGTAGKYDIELTVYDENDGQGFFDVFINGEFVQCFELDLDAGDNFTGVSSIRTLKIEGIELNVGDEVIVKGRQDHGEFARFDKIKFIQEKEAPGTIKGSVWCDIDCDGLQDSDVTITKGENLIVNGDFEDNCLYDSGATWGGLKSGWHDIGHKKVNLLEQDYGHGNATGDAVAELENGVILCQEVHVTDAGTYHLTFDVSRRGHSDQDNTFELFVNGHRLTTVIAQGQETLTFDLDLHEGVNRFDFKSLSHTYIGAAIDDVELRQVIETTTPSEPFKEGVVIKLLNADGTPVLDDNGVEITTVTDANGNYQFDDVPVGDYRIMGVAPDGTEFTLQDVGSDDTIDSDVDANGLSGVIHVSEEAVIDVDLGLKDKKPEFRVCDDPDAVNIDFEGFAAGTVIDDEYAGVGVTISAQRDDNNTPENDAMVFDSNNPTGGDTDLATTTQNNILIVSEDNDSSDPDDAIGGTITFDFDNPSFIYDIKAVDTEEGGTIDLFDADGNSLGSIVIPGIGDGDIQQVLIDTDGVSQMVITLTGSGAIDDLCFVPGEPAPGSITGTYFIDQNDNDVQDAVEPGLEGVRVMLLDANGDPTGDVTFTDANGNYVFGDVDAGTYGVKFDDPNGVIGARQLVDPNDPNGNGNDTNDSDAIGDTVESVISDIVVVSGEETANNDAGVEDLPGSLSGTYFIDQNDNDVQDAVEPGLEGVRVMLLDANGDPTGDVTFTDANGDYSFGDLDAGTYGVKFDDPNGVIGARQLVDPNDPNGNGNDTNDSDAIGDTVESVISDIVVVAGEDTPNNDAGVEDLPGGSITGTYFIDQNDNDVQDAVEPGLEGVRVMLLDANGDPTGDVTFTDANGNYVFGDVDAGTYGVKFDDPNGVIGARQLVDPNDPNGNGNDTNDSDAIGDTVESVISDIVVVSGEETANNDAGVEDLPGSLSGTYFIDQNDNDVQDAVEPGLEGVRVMLLDANGDPTGDVTFTDANGDYSFGDLDAGTYGVKFDDPNGVIGARQLVDPNDPNGNGNDTNDSDAIGDTVESVISDIVVVSGEETANNDAGVEDLPGSLSGTYFIDQNDNDVQDAVEPGLEGVRVMLLDANGDPTGDVTFTDANGDYSFGDLDAGTYGVKFDDPNGVIGARQLVDPNDPNGNGNDTNDSDAIGDTVESVISDIVVVAGEDTPNNDAGVEDLPGGSITGTYFIDQNDNDVQDAVEPGLEGVRVMLLDANGDPTGDVTFTDANGNYVFGDVDAGTYGVKFDDPNGVIGARQLVDPNDPNGNGNDTNDSDAIGDTVESVISDIVVVSGEETANNDAGVEDLPGSLSGTYFIDQNDNDVQDAVEPGLEGVRVMLLDANGDPTGDVTFTDANGDYSFGDLDAGTYGVKFDDPNGVIGARQLVDPNDPNGNGNDTNDSDAIGDTVESVISDIVVVAGEDTPNNDAGVEDLPGGSITGTYFIDQNDNDVQDAVEPGLEGVRVMLLDANGDPTGDVTFTDANGNYVFGDVDAGTYGVKFDDPNGVIGARQLVDPNDPNGNGNDTNDSDAIGDTVESVISDIVVVSGEETANNDAGVEDLPGSLSGTYFIDQNDNDVQDAVEPGLEGVRVMLLDANGDPTGDVTFTDANGDYSFGDLDAGTYGVKFDDPNGVIGARQLVDPNDPNGNGNDTNDSDAIGDTVESVISDIVVVAGEDTPNNDAGVEDLPGGSITGTYFIDQNDNDVQDAVEPGLEGVRVMLLDANGDPTGDVTFTDANGNYVFGDVDAGTYGVKFDDPNGVIGARQLVDPNDPNGNGNDTNDSDAIGDTVESVISDIVVVSGEETANNDAGVEDLPGSLSGTYFIDQNDNDVQDAVEPGLEGVRVMLLDANGDPTGDVTFTDANGDYSFGDLDAGTYGVKFDDPNGVIGARQLVDPNDPNGNGNDTNDSDAIGDTVESVISDIVVVAGEDTPNNDAGVEDLPGGSITGTYFIDQNDNDVQDAVEPGLEGVRVMLLDANGDPTGDVTFTDANGNYVFGDVDAGTYGVKFDDPNGVIGARQLVDPNDPNGNGNDTNDSDAIGDTVESVISDIVVVSGEETANNDAGVEDLPGSLSGTYFIDQNDNDVQDAVEPGLEGVRVMLLDANGDPTGDVTFTDANGDYSFGDLDAGTYGVKFDDPNGVIGARQLVDPNDPNGNGNDTNDSDAIGDTVESVISDIVVVSGEETANNDAGVEDLPGSLSGTYFIDQNDNDVQDAVEPGLEGVRVMLLDANGDPTGDVTFTDANGDYSFGDLDAGTYGVKFDDPNGVIGARQLVDPNDPNGNGNDTNDSDAIGDTVESVISDIVVVAGEDTPNNDAGVEDLPGGSITGTYFIDQNDNDVQDAVEPGLEGVRVMLLDANGDPTGDVTFTDANGNYVFGDVDAGTYGVKFDDPNGVIGARQLVDPNDPNGNGNDTNDSDAIGDTVESVISDIVVVSGEETANNDAGVEDLPGSLSGTYFIDQNDNDVQDAVEPGLEGVRVMLLDANGDPTGDVTFTDANGDYSFGDLDAGTYGVKFDDPNGVIGARQLVDPNDPNGNGNDTNDSDAIGDTVESVISDIVVVSGEETANNDAGVEDLPGSLSGRYFMDTDGDNQDNGNGNEPGIEGVLVELVDANGPTGITTTTTQNGHYSFSGLAAGTYAVIFTDPNGALAGKELVTPNQGPEASDSDAIGDTITSSITDIVVVAGEDTPDNDAGARDIPGSISGLVFGDEDKDDVQDPGEEGLAGITVRLLDSNGGELDTTTTGDGISAPLGFYEFTDLPAGDYTVHVVDPAPGADGFGFTGGDQTPVSLAPGQAAVVDDGLVPCFNAPNDGSLPGIPDANLVGPSIFFNNVGRTTYDADTDTFLVSDGIPLLFTDANGVDTPALPLDGFGFEYAATIDENGIYQGGVAGGAVGSGSDFVFWEDTDLDGEIDAGEEILLTADTLVFGSDLGQVAAGSFEAVLEVTGGSQQGDYSPLLVLDWVAESLGTLPNDGDVTGFSEDFEGQAKGDLSSTDILCLC